MLRASVSTVPQGPTLLRLPGHNEPQPPPAWESLGPQRTRSPHSTRSPPPPSSMQNPQLVKFRPDKLRQPELLRQLEERNPQSVRQR